MAKLLIDCLQSLDLTKRFIVDVWGKSGASALPSTREEELKISHNILKEHYKNSYIYFLEQVHGTHSLFVDLFENVRENKQNESLYWGRGDAAFSCRHDVALSVRVADCIPIIFGDQDQSFFGVIHAGWKGLYSQILSRTLQHIEEEIGEAKRSNLKFWVGPHIRGNSYETGEDVFSLFSPLFSKDSSEPKKKYLNLTEILRDQFINLGINDSQVVWDLNDTHNSNEYYSHRKGDIGRNIIVVHPKN